MGLIAKAKNSNEGWGMGFFLVFFSEDEPIEINNNKKNNLLSSSSSPSSNSSNSFKSTINSPMRRTNSNQLISKAQSTISICALLIFLSLLVFTLSPFEPTTTAAQFASRRHLSSNPQFPHKPTKNLKHSTSWFNILSPNSRYKPKIAKKLPSHALQGLGNLYRRGTKAMNDLIVGHVIESVTEQELRLFLRLLHRSSLTSRSDLVLIFSSQSDIAIFKSVIEEENESFSKLVNRSREVNGSFASFDVTPFVKSTKKERDWGEPIWGRRTRSNYSDDGDTESTRLSYGSVVSFMADELDPENSLAGFLDHVPMSLRRWACYPMLLGRVRRNFKHMMLVDVREVFLLGDPLSRLRTRSPESVHMATESTNIKHGKKNSVKTQSHSVSPAVVMGGSRGVRRLSNVMLTEIVRAVTQHKRKNPVTDSGLVNQLVGNEFLLKNANVVASTEPIPDASSLTGSNSNSGSSPLSLSKYTIFRRGNSNADVTSTLMRQVCSLEVDSIVYSDCS
ncbi:uncharacterized protein LOC130774044 [Actinidia eriantha]|uniref:uncharacterized protein LOC130774044 n=1 Tax=Actinidia eriantha TaxID=165200 RepID=UPI00258C871A|nr:uncharacterized protein LOC130774044 [Actinidia eriantha]